MIAAAAEAAVPGQADFVNPAELDNVDDLRQALQQANLLLLQERTRLQACMHATDDMVGVLGRLVTQFLANDAEGIADTLKGFIQQRVVVVGGQTGAGTLQ